MLPLNIYSSMYVTMNARVAHELPLAAHQGGGHALPVVPAARDRDVRREDGGRSGRELMPLTHAAFNANGRVARSRSVRWRSRADLGSWTWPRPLSSPARAPGSAPSSPVSSPNAAPTSCSSPATRTPSTRSRDRLRASYGVDVEVLVADLTVPRQRGKVVRRLQDPERPIEMLVNNAGYGLPLAFERNDIEDEARHLALHVEAPMRLAHAALEPMLARGSGRIINVASVAGFIPRGTYGAVKAWVISFSRWANVRYAPRGVTVTGDLPRLRAHQLPRAPRPAAGTGGDSRRHVAERRGRGARGPPRCRRAARPCRSRHCATRC